MKKIKRAFTSTLNWFKLVWFLPEVLGKDSPSIVLILIRKFINLEGAYFDADIYLGRSIQKSINLLNSLVEYYEKTKSEITLNQIMTVLKEEFIERK